MEGVGGGVWLCPTEASDILETQFKWKHMQTIFLLNFGSEPDYCFNYFFVRQDYFFKSPFETFFFLAYPKPGFVFSKIYQPPPPPPQKIKWSTAKTKKTKTGFVMTLLVSCCALIDIFLGKYFFDSTSGKYGIHKG